MHRIAQDFSYLTNSCHWWLETGSISSMSRGFIDMDGQDAQDFFWRRRACSPRHPQIPKRLSPESASRATAPHPDHPVHPVHRCSMIRITGLTGHGPIPTGHEDWLFHSRMIRLVVGGGGEACLELEIRLPAGDVDGGRAAFSQWSSFHSIQRSFRLLDLAGRPDLEIAAEGLLEGLLGVVRENVLPGGQQPLDL